MKPSEGASGAEAPSLRKPVAALLAAVFLLPGSALAFQFAFLAFAPEWKEGDAWTYRDRSVVTVTFEGPGEPVRETVVDELVHTLRVIDDRSEFEGVPVYEMATLVNARRVETFPVVRTTGNPIAGSAVAGAWREIPVLLFPLYAGKTWTDGGDVAPTYRVADRDLLDVAGAHVAAIRVEKTGSTSPSTEAASGVAARTSETYWYAPAVGNVVRSHVAIDMRVESLRDPGYALDLAIRVERELVRATALAGPELPFVDVDLLLPAPLNLAERSAATFAASDSPAPPPGSVHRWTIDGRSYEGDVVAAAFASPGWKKVSVERLLGEVSLGGAEALYEVSFQETFRGVHTLAPGVREHLVPSGAGTILRARYTVAGGLPTGDAGDDVALVGPSGEAMGTGHEFQLALSQPGALRFVVRPDALEHARADYALHVDVRAPSVPLASALDPYPGWPEAKALLRVSAGGPIRIG